MATRIDSIGLPRRRSFRLRWPALWLNDRTKRLYIHHRNADFGHLRARFNACFLDRGNSRDLLDPAVQFAASWQDLRTAVDELVRIPAKAHHTLWWHLGHHLAGLRPRYIWNDRRYSRDEALNLFQEHFMGGS